VQDWQSHRGALQDVHLLRILFSFLHHLQDSLAHVSELHLLRAQRYIPLLCPLLKEYQCKIVDKAGADLQAIGFAKIRDLQHGFIKVVQGKVF
jgi:capsular polysaccharide biosynthesis protein